MPSIPIPTMEAGTRTTAGGSINKADLRKDNCRLCNSTSPVRTIVPLGVRHCKNCYLWRKRYLRETEESPLINVSRKRGRKSLVPWKFDPWTGERI